MSEVSGAAEADPEAGLSTSSYIETEHRQWFSARAPMKGHSYSYYRERPPIRPPSMEHAPPLLLSSARSQPPEGVSEATVQCSRVCVCVCCSVWNELISALYKTDQHFRIRANYSAALLFECWDSVVAVNATSHPRSAEAFMVLRGCRFQVEWLNNYWMTSHEMEPTTWTKS